MEGRAIDINSLSRFSKGIKNCFFKITTLNGEQKEYYSDAVEDITGYSADEIVCLPQKFNSIIFSDDIKTIKNRIDELEEDMSRDSIEIYFRIQKKDGEILWLKESAKIERDDIGRINEIRSILTNVDDIKHSELELLQTADKLKELNASKDKFISIVSHDLRAPFTTLLGFSEILLNEEDLSDDEKSEYLKYIYESSKSQLDMINCLLDWSRLQTGRIKIEPLRLNVKASISTAIAPLTGTAVRKNIDIKSEIPSDIFMNADERLIGQAIYHLVANAIKYTPERRNVYVSAGRFKAGMIEIVVRDEGVGIAEENHPKLFKIDQKFALAGTGGEKGSGLGLTLVKEIIEKHGGDVWFYSQPDEGSEFHFTVPEASNLILLVEDEQSIQTLYKKTIEINLPDFEIYCADNGYEAISKLAELSPTLLITDHDMPLMNGIQLVEALQNKESGRTIPVIVVSAKLSEDISGKYRKLGVEHILPKPVDLHNLISLIKESIYLA